MKIKRNSYVDENLAIETVMKTNDPLRYSIDVESMNALENIESEQSHTARRATVCPSILNQSITEKINAQSKALKRSTSLPQMSQMSRRSEVTIHEYKLSIIQNKGSNNYLRKVNNNNVDYDRSNAMKDNRNGESLKCSSDYVIGRTESMQCDWKISKKSNKTTYYKESQHNTLTTGVYLPYIPHSGLSKPSMLYKLNYKKH